MNKVILMGNLGQDPELRFTQSGTAVLNMRLATSERYKDASGEWLDKTEWHTVIVWAKRAEALAKILSKGRKILIEGSLQTRDWEDKSGNKRYSTEVVAREVELCDKRQDDGGQRREPEAIRGPGEHDRQPPQQQAPGDAFGPDDGSIPF